MVFMFGSKSCSLVPGDGERQLGAGVDFVYPFAPMVKHQTQLLNITVKANQGRHSNGF